MMPCNPTKVYRRFEERTASIFRVEVEDKQVTNKQTTRIGFLDPEDGGSKILRNISKFYQTI
jgi:hypothetical protein